MHVRIRGIVRRVDREDQERWHRRQIRNSDGFMLTRQEADEQLIAEVKDSSHYLNRPIHRREDGQDAVLDPPKRFPDWFKNRRQGITA